MTTTLFIKRCLDRLRDGDLQARDELMAKFTERLRALTARMLRLYPRVARWEEADDIFQQAAMRLHKCLADVSPLSVERFYGLAAIQLQRELKDMARKHFGPEGIGANHDSGGRITRSVAPKASDHSMAQDCPELLARWTEFHDAADQLPDIEKRTFDLLWYHGLTQSEAAEILGVSDRQVRRYWNSGKLRLRAKLDNLEPLE